MLSEGAKMMSVDRFLWIFELWRSLSDILENSLLFFSGYWNSLLFLIALFCVVFLLCILSDVQVVEDEIDCFCLFHSLHLPLSPSIARSALCGNIGRFQRGNRNAHMIIDIWMKQHWSANEMFALFADRLSNRLFSICFIQIITVHLSCKKVFIPPD